MAFTGVAVISKVADGIVRITGLSLAAGATGTISMEAGTGAVKFGATQGIPEWHADAGVTLIEAVEVSTHPASDVSNFAIPIRVTKTGVDPSDFLITLENDEAAVASPDLEIYIKFHT
jgi:hypothetical protein